MSARSEITSQQYRNIEHFVELEHRLQICVIVYENILSYPSHQVKTLIVSRTTRKDSRVAGRILSRGPTI